MSPLVSIPPVTSIPDEVVASFSALSKKRRTELFSLNIAQFSPLAPSICTLALPLKIRLPRPLASSI